MPVTFHRSREQVTAPSINYQTTQILLGLIEHFVKGLLLGDTFNTVYFVMVTCTDLYSDLWKSDLYFGPAENYSTFYARKLCSETTRLRLVVPLEFWTFYDVISMAYKSVNHGKLWSICWIKAMCKMYTCSGSRIPINGQRNICLG